MAQTIIVFVLIALLSVGFKDYLLASASVSLLVLTAVDAKPAIGLLQKYAFNIGIFFLMIFILLPLASGRIQLLQVAKQLFSPLGLLAVLAGISVSYIGGQGVSVLPNQPLILMGVLIGTLVAVLLLKGLPAGLIIAAGLVGIVARYIH